MAASQESIKLKEKQVNELAEKIKGSKTLMIVSIKSLPSRQFNEIKKAVRSEAYVKIAKKNIIIRTIKKIGGSILPLEEHVDADCAMIISDKEGYELAGLLSKRKTPVFAKAGQIATNDIEVKSGPTDLVPGPAISELGAVGIQIAVQDGKISIKAPKVVVNEGQEIKENVASLLQKLNIQPFSVGLNPVVVYDVESEKIYTDIKIDPEGYADELKEASGKALGFAQKIVYFCKDTIGYFLSKANMEGEKLGELGADEKVEEVKEEKDSPERDGGNDGESKEVDGAGEGVGDGEKVEEKKKEVKDINEEEEVK